MTRRFRSVFAVALLVLLCGAPPLLAQQAATQADPYNVIYPILGWLPVYGIDLSLPSGPPCVGCPPDATVASGSSGLSGAWFAGMRLEFGRFELLGDFNWAGLSAEKDLPFFHAKVDIFTAAILGGVRVYGPWFVEAGARYHGLDASFDILTFPAVQWSPGRWAPAVGTTFRPRLGKKWLLYSHVDFAGLGVHDIETINGAARLEWRPLKHLSITGGYGFGTVTLDGDVLNRHIHLTETLHGPIAGIGVPF